MLTDNLPSRTLSVDVFARADCRLIAQLKITQLQYLKETVLRQDFETICGKIWTFTGPASTIRKRSVFLDGYIPPSTRPLDSFVPFLCPA